MKNCLFLAFVLLLAGCTNKTQTPSRQYIEPCDYHIMSYQVKDVAYHDSVKSFLDDNSYISIVGDSTFNVTNELGDFLFNGSSFSYKIIDDSLILSNNKHRMTYRILDLDANAFKLEVDNKYFDRIDMIKPKDKRRRIEKTVKIEY